MIEPLAVYLFIAMISWIPMNQHAWREAYKVTEGRYAQIARDIAAVSLDQDELPLFDGDHGRERTALLLASLASFESAFRSDVDDCTLRGDHGLALSLFQVHGPAVLLCGDRITAVRVALGMMRESFRVCRGWELENRLGWYANGGPKCTESPKSRARILRAVAYERAHPFSATAASGLVVD